MIGALKQKIGHRSPVRLGYHFAKAWLAAAQARFPAKHLTVIGITGTDGKTTTVGMLAHILHEAGLNVGALSTAFLRVRGQVEWNKTQKTSPSPAIIQQFLRRLVDEKCTHVVLECSSHGLVQGRLHYTWPAMAAITNTSMEHLDYHGSMEQYRQDKGKLFAMLKGRGTKILNQADGTFASYSQIPSQHTYSYGLEQPQEPNSDLSIWLREVTLDTHQSIAHICTSDGQEQTLTLNIPGSYNLENALCALSCAQAAGVTLEQGCLALASFRGAPGRLELIESPQPFAVYVDFTVTPGAYEKTLTTLRHMLAPGKRLLVLTGSCGDRMPEKRPIVGQLCSELADVVVVTNEDPYTEDPQKIIDEVWAGVDQNHCQAKQIFDRREAMQWLFQQAQPGDIVILCAKGSDTTMWTANGQVPWNEREIAKELLHNLSG